MHVVTKFQIIKESSNKARNFPWKIWGIFLWHRFCATLKEILLKTNKYEKEGEKKLLQMSLSSYLIRVWFCISYKDNLDI
jgi:hypothetical protein